MTSSGHAIESEFPLAVVFANGNARTNIFNTAFNAAKSTAVDKAIVDFSQQIYGSTRTNGIVGTNANAIRGEVVLVSKLNRNLAPRLVSTAIKDYVFDQFQDLDLRFIIRGGDRCLVHEAENSRPDLFLGADFG